MQDKYVGFKPGDRKALGFRRLPERAAFLLLFAQYGALSHRDACRLVMVANKSAPTLADYYTVEKIAARVVPYGYAGEPRA